MPETTTPEQSLQALRNLEASGDDVNCTLVKNIVAYICQYGTPEQCAEAQAICERLGCC